MTAAAAKPRIAVLFVCMGNICRSPTAEAVFRRLAPTLAPEIEFEIDSAGTHGYHIGAPPDQRSQRAALEHGIDMSGLRARQLEPRDFDRFDWIVFMDETNRRDALKLSRPQGAGAVGAAAGFCPRSTAARRTRSLLRRSRGICAGDQPRRRRRARLHRRAARLSRAWASAGPGFACGQRPLAACRTVPCLVCTACISLSKG